MSETTKFSYKRHSIWLIGTAFFAISMMVAIGSVNQERVQAQVNQRQDDLTNLLWAVREFQLSPSALGLLPYCQVSGQDTQIPECDAESDNSSFDGAIELGQAEFDCRQAFVPGYLIEMPLDPFKKADEQNSGYFICQKEKQVYLLAPHSPPVENGFECEKPWVAEPSFCISG